VSLGRARTAHATTADARHRQRSAATACSNGRSAPPTLAGFSGVSRCLPGEASVRIVLEIESRLERQRAGRLMARKDAERITQHLCYIRPATRKIAYVVYSRGREDIELFVKSVADLS
jgi:hypothetical protein